MSTKSKPAAKTAVRDPRLPSTPATAAAPPAPDDGDLKPRTKKEDKASYKVPRAFNLTLDDSSVVRIEAGVQDLPKAYGEHWYAKANGVVPHDGSADE